MDFNVSGLFYERKIGNNLESLRSILEIKHKNLKASEPDLIIVMMNPGKSSPVDSTAFFASSNLPIGTSLPPINPDRTQFQIMKLMTKLGLNFGRVINLSDLRTPKSEVLYEKLAMYKEDNSHSIFSETRSTELNSLLGHTDIPILAAWGISRKLLPLSIIAMEKLKHRKIFGLKSNDLPLYLHPLPRQNQDQWLEKVFLQMKGG